MAMTILIVGGKRVKDLAKRFFSNKTVKIEFWIILWIFEYFLCSWGVNKLSDSNIKRAIVLGYM